MKAIDQELIMVKIEITMIKYETEKAYMEYL